MATYADDIKRLAQGDKLRDALGAWAARDPINGSITPYINAVFSTSSNGGESGTDNSTADSTNDNGSTEQDGTQPTDGTDPNTFYKGGGGGTGDATQTGEQDAESVIDGDVPQQVTGSDYQSTNYDGPGAMTSMTNMTDCDDNDLKVRFDGEYAPPDGWDDPDAPPSELVEGWVLGVVWARTNAPDVSFNGCLYTAPNISETYYSKSLAQTASLAELNIVLSYFQGCSPSVTFRLVNGDPTGESNNYTSNVERFTGGSWEPLFSHLIQLQPCSIDIDPLCPSVQPGITPTEWPIDGSYNLSLVDGAFQANQYDSEAPLDAGGSSVDIKYGTSGTGRITATAQGGYMVYATSGCGGAPTGIVKVYNKDGTFAAAGDATQTFMDQYLPK